MECKLKMEVNRKITGPSPLLCGEYNKSSAPRGSDPLLLHGWTSSSIFSECLYGDSSSSVVVSFLLKLNHLCLLLWWPGVPLCTPKALSSCSPFYKQIQARNSLWNQRHIILIQTLDLPFVLPSPLSGILAQMALLFGSMPCSCQGTKLFVSKHGCKGSQRMLLRWVR